MADCLNVDRLNNMILVQSKTEFIDIRINKTRQYGDIFEVSLDRFNELRKNGVPVEVIRADYTGKKKKKGPKVIIYQKLLYRIGGIETWGLNLAKIFEDRDITFVFSEADSIQLMEFAKYANVIIDDGERWYNCDVFISANYDGGAVILDRIKAKKRYQTIHSDFEALKKVNGWTNFELDLDGRFDRIISASETAQKGLKRGFGYESVVITNPLVKLEEKPLIFLTLSRASEEKGIFRMAQLARRFEGSGKRFIWLVCSTLDNAEKEVRDSIRSIPQMVIVEPQFYSKYLMFVADYVVQLSDTEAYCYSIHESLISGVPVIATPFEQAKKIIKPGENGYIVNFDLSDVNVDEIFNKVPKGFKYEEKINPLWKEVLDGKL